MNLSDAIKSGLPFRCTNCPKCSNWIKPGDPDLANGAGNLLTDWDMGGCELTAWHVVYGEWEIEGKTVEITCEHFFKVANAMTWPDGTAYKVKELAEKLGLV